MAVHPNSLPMVVPADDAQGPGQGRWTYDDYAILPNNGQQYEVVNGTLFKIPPHEALHQETMRRFSSLLSNRVESIGKVYTAPFDIELAPNTVVRPDVFIVLDKDRDKVQIRGTHVIGTPSLIIEVTESASDDYDWWEKYSAYLNAKVPEYWAILPEAKAIIVMTWATEDYDSLGVFGVAEPEKIVCSHVLPQFEVPIEQFFPTKER